METSLAVLSLEEVTKSVWCELVVYKLKEECEGLHDRSGAH